MAPAFPEYTWIAVVGSILGFIYAFGIGANDVANAFASTVASRSLTLKQAVLVAAIFEFSGAMLLGSAVTNTIRSKIFDIDIYDGEQDIVLLGMFTSLITAVIMLMGATAIGLPVSTTQTVVGCIMGFTIAAKGLESVNKKIVYQIFLSWILSPGVSGIVGFLFFGSIKIFIHNSAHPYTRAYYTFPLVLTIFIGIIMFYVMYKGVSNNYEDALSLSWVLPAAFGMGAFCGLLWLFPFGPMAKKRIEARAEAREALAADEEQPKELKEDDEGDVEGDAEKTPEEMAAPVEESLTKPVVVEKTVEPAEETAPEDGKKSFMARAAKSFADNTYNQDLQATSFHENKTCEQLWDKSDKFDEKTEDMFSYVQVFSACMNSFSHGANDVANSVGPMSAILMIYQTGELNSKTGVQKWILAYGAAGIVVGLLCYGYKVMRSLGYKITALSPSRGACAELAASLYVVTASYLEIPVSSTQCIVGAVTGVGLVGGLKAIGWWFFLRICIGWVLEFFSAVFLSMGIFSMFAFSPSLMYD